MEYNNEDLDRGIFNLTEDVDGQKKLAEAKAGSMTTEDYNTFRFLAKTDLFFLSTGILGYDRFSPNLHGNLAGWMHDTNEKAQFRLILLPRGHLKSTEVTIADGLQIVLPDDATGFTSPYPRNLGPNCRLCLAHEAREQAQRFLFSITSHVMSNTLLMALFPEIIPNPRKHKINQAELVLPRTKNHPEPTIDTMSTGSRGQGRHYNYLKLDDLIGDKARDSEAEMDAAIKWFDNIQSFFSKFTEDKFDLVGTRWGMNDIYQHAMKTYEGQLYKYIRPVVEVNPETKLKEPIFPEEFTHKSLAILRKNPIVFNSQYLNDPTEGAQEFNPAWKRFYIHGKSVKELIPLEPGMDSYSKLDEDTQVSLGLMPKEEYEFSRLMESSNVPRVINIDSLDICFLIDPAMTGLMGFIVAGMDKDQNVYILEAIKDALRPPQFLELFFDKVRKWWPRIASIEAVLFSGLYAHWLPSEMIHRGLKVPIYPYDIKRSEKDARVRALTNPFSQGKIYFHPSQTDLIEEYDYFGTGSKYHLLDALEQYKTVMRPGNLDQFRNKEMRKQAITGDRYTGYNSIRG